MEQATQPGTHKGCYVRDLTVHQDATFQAVVKQKDFRQRKEGESFITLTLGDCTGEIEAVRWECGEEETSLLAVGAVVKVRGSVSEYRGKPQLRIERWRLAKPEEVCKSDFVASSVHDPVEMLRELQTIVGSVQDPKIRQLLTLLIEDHAEQLLVAPAAQKIHHCFAGGLLEHILSMAKAADLMAGHYQRLNRDWLLAGVVLHDFGKLQELRMELHIGYTVPGQIIGHIGLGLLLLERYALKVGLDDDLKAILQHLIASHHGALEYGALKLPMTAEAIALHYIDELDARLEQAFRVLDATPAGEDFSTYVPAMSRVLYRPRNSAGS